MKRFLVMLLLAVLTACSGAPKRMSIANSDAVYGFLQSGKTTRRQVESQIGFPMSTFKKSNVVIYTVMAGTLKVEKDGRTGRQKAKSGQNWELVIAYDESDVVIDHSLLRTY